MRVESKDDPHQPKNKVAQVRVAAHVRAAEPIQDNIDCALCQLKIRNSSERLFCDTSRRQEKLLKG